MENTIIVVVGDHGEEFNEFGRFAHSYSLKNVQTSTPFIMHIPNTKKTQFNITSHADIMPTIIDYLNISIPFETFLSGKSLLKYDQSDDYAIIQECQIETRPKKFAIADRNWKMEFRLSGNKIESGKLFSINDEPVNNLETNRSDFIEIKKPLISKAKKNLNHFSKSN